MSFIPVLSYLSVRNNEPLERRSTNPHPLASALNMDAVLEDILIRDMVQAAEQLKHRPIDSLARYSNEIYQLHESLKSLRSSIDINLLISNSSDIEAIQSKKTVTSNHQGIFLGQSRFQSDRLTRDITPNRPINERQILLEKRFPELGSSKMEISTQEMDLSAAEFLRLVETALVSGLECIAPFYSTILEFGHENEGVCVESQRSQHLQPIQTIQRKKPSKHIVVPDRLLLVGAAMSLAKDFREFERDHGWTPKQDQLIERILKNEDPASQKLGKHLQNFVAIHGTVNIDRDKLDAGLRLGTKLFVVDAISQSLDLGHSLPLLLGFECVKLSRLNYRAFSSFAQVIKANPQIYNTLTQISKSFDHWWLTFHVHYHQHNGTYGRTYTPQFNANSTPAEDVYASPSGMSSQSSRMSIASGSEPSVNGQPYMLDVGGELHGVHTPIRPSSSAQMMPRYASPTQIPQTQSSNYANASYGLDQGQNGNMYSWTQMQHPGYASISPQQEPIAWNINIYDQLQTPATADSSGECVYSTHAPPSDQHYSLG